MWISFIVKALHDTLKNVAILALVKACQGIFCTAISTVALFLLYINIYRFLRIFVLFKLVYIFVYVYLLSMKAKGRISCRLNDLK